MNSETNDGPVYARRQTPEEIEEMLTPRGPIGGETTPPFGCGAPAHEQADAAAEKAFHRRNALHAATVKALDAMGFPTMGLESDLHEPGAKADSNKLDLTLVPGELEEAVAEILMFGAQKYSRNGWKHVPDASRRYFAALERHIKAFKRGEDLDPESGLHHLAHATCNLAFLLYFLRTAGTDVGAWRDNG
jgi:hypothetical protein